MAASIFKLTSSASTNLTSINGTTPNTDLYGYEIYNTNAAARFVKLYWGPPGSFSGGGDSPTVGTDKPAMTIQVGATAPARASFPTGIGGPGTMFMAMTTGAADTDNTAVGAGDLIASLMIG